MTISLGFWLFPALITFIVFWWADSNKYDKEASASGYIPLPNNISETLIASVVSGASWLIYFVIAMFVNGSWL